MHFEYTIVIDQPVEKVFGYMSNPMNLPEWQGPPAEIRDLQQTTPGQLREGDRFTTILQFPGRRYETPTEVSAMSRTGASLIGALEVQCLRR